MYIYIFLIWLVCAEAEFYYFNKIAHASYESPSQCELYIATVKILENFSFPRFSKSKVLIKQRWINIQL